MYLSESGKHLYQFYKQKEEVFFENFQIIRKNPTVASFHDFRVSIKRIKAIFRLLDLIASDFNSTKHLKPFRTVFNPAGKIREAQVNLITIKRFQPKQDQFEQFERFCKAQEIKYLVKLQDRLKVFNHKGIKVTKKLIKEHSKEIITAEVIKKSGFFIHDRIEIIEENFSVPQDEVSVHQARINLKEISAILTLLKKIDIEGIDNQVITWIKSVEDKLGLWHDQVVLRNAIGKFLNRAKVDESVLKYFNDIQSEVDIEASTFLQHVSALMETTLKELQLRIKVVLNTP